AGRGGGGAAGELGGDALVRIRGRGGAEEPAPLPEEGGPAEPLLLLRQVIHVAAEERDAHRLVPVQPPRHGVRQVEEVGDLAELGRGAEDLAAAEEVPRLERELSEEPVEARVARAELDLVAGGLLALDGDVDLLLLLV